MKKYILDTNILSYLEKSSKHYTKINSKLLELKSDDEVFISIISLYELAYGLNLVSSKEAQQSIKATMEFIKEYLKVIPLDLKEVDIFASLKSKYKQHTGINKNAIKKHNLDFLLASTALAENAIIVSNDEIFKTLSELEPNLQYENWTN